jgi:hypothetical protein
MTELLAFFFGLGLGLVLREVFWPHASDLEAGLPGAHGTLARPCRRRPTRASRSSRP